MQSTRTLHSLSLAKERTQLGSQENPHSFLGVPGVFTGSGSEEDLFVVPQSEREAKRKGDRIA